MSRAKQKGTIAESALVAYLRNFGFPFVERRALTGSVDLGDITGIPGLVIEVKNHKTYKIPQWMDETKLERENAKADYGILVIKPNGIGLTNQKNWWAVLDVEALVRLLREAGYGDSLES